VFTLEHRVRVFVFQVREEDVQFLLLRHKPTTEWPLGPVVGPVAPSEQMQNAVFREVSSDTGLHQPLHLIELDQPRKELFGDVGLVEWPFAWQAAGPSDPAPALKPGPNVGEFAWMGFEEAFHSLDGSDDRQTLVQLRLALGA